MVETWKQVVARVVEFCAPHVVFICIITYMWLEMTELQRKLTELEKPSALSLCTRLRTILEANTENTLSLRDLQTLDSKLNCCARSVCLSALHTPEPEPDPVEEQEEDLPDHLQNALSSLSDSELYVIQRQLECAANPDDPSCIGIG
eukprot:TRINITY_DN94642_c0_g1_i1.p2 TRINITY_DN94642_c0_g1~~TRINITY_DN94642_c0_g1_i1.p2  ORF type:complete len:147 (-),score=3.16 TRINITY_DN94642_c0_g1_i1:536-976(-)